MTIGFDFGTANCSVAHFFQQQVQPIPLFNNAPYLLSSLCAPNPETVSEYLFRCQDIRPSTPEGEQVLRRAIKINREEGLDVSNEDLKFGGDALDLYLQDPSDVYYVKSPKSFLGTMGLREVQLSFFEDLVCALMSEIKHRAEDHLQHQVEQAVIGRPINFLGRGGDKSNRQAIGILERAAKRSGFKSVEFQYEPVAAGLDFEASLNNDKHVLVVDIGGGTTDCSMLRMGPSWVGKQDRSNAILAHSGQMVGGNNLDIAIAFKSFMAEFGKETQRKSGLDIPLIQFWNAIAVNDVQAQKQFYLHDNLAVLKQFHKESLQPEKVARLIKLYQEKLSYSVIHQAEQTKIALSESDQHLAQLTVIDETISIPVSKSEMQMAIESSTTKIESLVLEAVAQSGITPDVIYMTGGSSRSTVLRDAVQGLLPNTPMVAGDHFGSVTAGLTRWADTIFK